MPTYSIKTNLSPEDAINKAVSFFGEDGLGLKIKDRGERCVNFIGGGGHIDISACRDDGKTELDFETREWDYHVKSFIKNI